MKAILPDAKIADAPMLRGRIVKVKGVAVDQLEVDPDARWVLAGDRGLTYTDEVPPSSTIVEGEWWPKGYSGEPLVSFDEEIAKGLGLKLGDHVTVNILGRNVDAKIASLRKIDWESLAINFVMVFSPNTLQGAPHRVLTTLEFPKGTDPAREGKVVQALAEAFPLVTAIKVGDIVEAAKEMLAKVMSAIRVTAGVTLLIGAAVLAGAVAAGQQQRKYLAVLYKTLGATRLAHHQRRAARVRPARPCHGAARGRHRHADRLGLVQMGLRGALRVHAACRSRDGAARAWSRAWRRRDRHLARAIGQGRALSQGRIILVVIARLDRAIQ